MTPDEPLVYDRVAAVLRDMPAIGKNSSAPGSMGGYSFRSIEDITSQLKPLLAKQGIVVVPNVVERLDSTRPVGNNRQMFAVDLHVVFTFYAADGSFFAASMWGQGTDMGDKATQKAVTSAFKSMLTVTFCIADGDSEAFEVPETQQNAGGAAAPRTSLQENAGSASSAPPQKNRRAKLKARCVALTGDGVSVHDARESEGLPLVDSCDEDELTRFENLVTTLEKSLEAPFVKADA